VLVTVLSVLVVVGTPAMAGHAVPTASTIAALLKCFIVHSSTLRLRSLQRLKRETRYAAVKVHESFHANNPPFCRRSGEVARFRASASRSGELGDGYPRTTSREIRIAVSLTVRTGREELLHGA